jgi:hypothetical protein
VTVNFAGASLICLYAIDGDVSTYYALRFPGLAVPVVTVVALGARGPAQSPRRIDPRAKLGAAFPIEQIT